jgi:hypothetical protein
VFRHWIACLSVLARSSWTSILRAAAFFFVAGTATGSLVLWLPAVRYYDTMDYAQSHFDVQVDGLLTDAAITTLQGFAGPDSFLTFDRLTDVRLQANGKSLDNSQVLLTSDVSRLDSSWFPDSTVVSGTATADVGPEWLDVSAHVARTLDVGVGDVLSYDIAGREVTVRVRRVMAISSGGVENIAVGNLGVSVKSILGAQPNGEFPTEALLQTKSSVEQIRSALSGRSLDGKPLEYQVLSRLQWLNLTPQDPIAVEPAVAAGTLLGLGCLMGLALREGVHLILRRSKELAVLSAIGVSRQTLIVALVGLEAVAIAVALALAYEVIVSVSYAGLLKDALPPILRGPTFASLMAAAVGYAIVLGVGCWRTLARTNVMQLLQGRVL